VLLHRHHRFLDDSAPSASYVTAAKRTRYNTRLAVDAAHRSAAKSVMVATAYKAGEKLSDLNPDAPALRSEILAGMHDGLALHNGDLVVTEARAAAMMKGAPVS
jgi:hypothetical protein